MSLKTGPIRILLLAAAVAAAFALGFVLRGGGSAPGAGTGGSAVLEDAAPVRRGRFLFADEL